MTAPRAPAEVLEAIHDALNAGPDLAALDRLLAPDFRHEADGGLLDRARYLEIQQAYAEGFSGFLVMRQTVLVDGDWVAAHVRVRGTQTGAFLGHPPSGRSFEAAGIDLFRIADGLAAEGCGVFDTFAMVRQLGLAAS